MPTYNIEEVGEIVEVEGLGYAIQDYMTGASIEDPVLAKKWDECKELMHEIRDILFPGGIVALDEPARDDDEDDEDDEDWDDDDFDDEGYPIV